MKLEAAYPTPEHQRAAEAIKEPFVSNYKIDAVADFLTLLHTRQGHFKFESAIMEIYGLILTCFFYARKRYSRLSTNSLIRFPPLRSTRFVDPWLAGP